MDFTTIFDPISNTKQIIEWVTEESFITNFTSAYNQIPDTEIGRLYYGDGTIYDPIRPRDLMMVLTNTTYDTAPTEKLAKCVTFNWSNNVLSGSFTDREFTAAECINYDEIKFFYKTGNIEVTATSSSNPTIVATVWVMSGFTSTGTGKRPGIKIDFGVYYDSGTSTLKRVVKPSEVYASSISQPGFKKIADLQFTEEDLNSKLYVVMAYQKWFYTYTWEDSGTYTYVTEYVTGADPGSEDFVYATYGLNANSLISPVDTSGLAAAISSINEDIEEINETLADIPDQIEEAVSTAAKEIMSEQASQFVAR